MDNNGSDDTAYSINLGKEQIKVKGKLKNSTDIEIKNIKIDIKGKYIRIAEVREEWDEDITNPKLTINMLKKRGVRIDLFTFVQRLPESRPKYNYYMEWDNVAAIPITSYEYWLKNQIPKQTRNRIKKAIKTGVVIKNIDIGEELFKVPTPRTRKIGILPGAPDTFETCNPATFPCKDCSNDDAGIFVKSFPLTELTEPVRSLFFILP